MIDTGPITREEMVRLFGAEMPIEAVRLVWEAPGDWTLKQIRGELREIAKRRDQRAIVEVTQADREAAAGIGERFAKWTPAQVQKTLDGRGDEYPITQAFARHRLASANTLPKGQDREDGLGAEQG